MRPLMQPALAAMALCLGVMSQSAHAVVAVIGCTVSAAGVTFPAYSPTSGASVTGTGNVGVTCLAISTGVASYTIALSAGSGSFASRTLLAPGPPAYSLNYNLYTDNARTMIWGDGTSGTSVDSDSYNILSLPITHNFTVYGYIPQSQISAGVGTYNDTVTITVSF